MIELTRELIPNEVLRLSLFGIAGIVIGVVIVAFVCILAYKFAE